MKRNITNTKEFILEEGERINGTLLAFENKFEKILENVKESSKNQIENVEANLNKKIFLNEKNLGKLEEAIEEEKKERIEQFQESHEQIYGRLEKVEENQENTQLLITEECKGIRQDLENYKFILEEKIRQEKRERLEKENQFRNEIFSELDFQKKFVEKLNNNLSVEFNHVTTNLQKEIQHRLKEQDEILENLSKVVVTLQKTLEILGTN